MDEAWEKVYERAVKLTRKKDGITASVLMKELGLGLTRAGRILDRMKQEGIVVRYQMPNGRIYFGLVSAEPKISEASRKAMCLLTKHSGMVKIYGPAHPLVRAIAHALEDERNAGLDIASAAALNASTPQDAVRRILLMKRII